MFLIENPLLNGTAGGIDSLDLTTTPPTRSTTFATASGANFMTFGPDGCIYAAQGTTVFRVTDTSSNCRLWNHYAGHTHAGALADLGVT